MTSTPPNEFLCPISQEVMREPVIASDGHSYDRVNIERWLADGHVTSPLTNGVIDKDNLLPNHALKKMIEDWKDGNTSDEGVKSEDSTSASSQNTTPVLAKSEPTELALQVRNAGDLESSEYCHVKIVTPETVNGDAHRLHIVFVVDVSGSMGMSVEAPNENGQKEDHGFSVLDLVKHSLLTICRSLTDAHMVSLVSFHTTAKIECRLVPMTESGRKRMEQAIKNLEPLNSTNLWDGLRVGLDVVKEELENAASTTEGDNFRNEILLFTDGQPNNHPPRGYIPTIERYLETKNIKKEKVTIRTFGFGYNLDCKLLEDIANFGLGNFGFIPDAGFVGTIFIHSVADILCSCHIQNLQLHVSFKQEDEFEVDPTLWNGTFMGYKHMEDALSQCGNTITMSLGSVQAGQNKDFLIRTDRKPISSVAISYYDIVSGETVRKELNAANFQANGGASWHDFLDITDTEDVAITAHKARLTLVDTIHDLMTRTMGSYSDATKEAVGEFTELIAAHNTAVAGTNSGDAAMKKLLAGVLADLKGQVTEAFSRQDWFRRWGEYYLRSLIFAHQLQKRNNFKDVGVQEYGGKCFEALVDRVNDIFDSCPPPEPSNANRGYGGMRAAPMTQHQWQQAYRNVAGPCFTGDSTMLVHSCEGNGVAALNRAEPSKVRCADIKRGDYIVTGVNMNSAKKVLCVIETRGKGLKGLRAKRFGNLGITPWHPVAVDGKWVFPAESDEFEPMEKDLDVVYNFLLEEPSKHVRSVSDVCVFVNDVPTILFGHGITERKKGSDDIFAHKYFGNWHAVKSDLEGMTGYAAHGRVILDGSNAQVKDPQTGLVCKLVQDLSELSSSVICTSIMQDLSQLNSLLKSGSFHDMVEDDLVQLNSAISCSTTQVALMARTNSVTLHPANGIAVPLVESW